MAAFVRYKVPLRCEPLGIDVSSQLYGTAIAELNVALFVELFVICSARQAFELGRYCRVWHKFLDFLRQIALKLRQYPIGFMAIIPSARC